MTMQVAQMPSSKVIEFLFSATLVLFLGWVLWEPQTWPAPARLFPRSLGFSVLVLALIQLAAAARAVLSERRTGAVMTLKQDLSQDLVNSRAHHVAESDTAPELTGRRAMTICAWLVAFFLGIWLVGFTIGSFVLTFVFLKFTAKEKWPISAAMALGTGLFFWLVFEIGLKLPLGNGVLADYLSAN